MAGMSAEAERVTAAVQENSDHITALRGEIADLRAEQKLAMREAIVEALREVITDKETMPAFWGSAFDHLSEQGVKGAGRIVIGGFGSALRLIFWVVVGGLVLFQWGGLPLVIKGFKALFSAPP